MKNKIIQVSILGLVGGGFMAISLIATLTIYAGSLNPTASNGLSNGSPIASMLSLLDMAQMTQVLLIELLTH